MKPPAFGLWLLRRFVPDRLEDDVFGAPLPYDRPQELVVVGGERADVGRRDLRVSGPLYADVLEGASSLQAVGAAYVIDANITNGERPERMSVALVTSDFLHLLHAAPAIGRDFEPADAGVDIGYVMLLSYAAWQRMYGAIPRRAARPSRSTRTPSPSSASCPKGSAIPSSPRGRPSTPGSPSIRPPACSETGATASSTSTAASPTEWTSTRAAWSSAPWRPGSGISIRTSIPPTAGGTSRPCPCWTGWWAACGRRS